MQPPHSSSHEGAHYLAGIASSIVILLCLSGCGPSDRGSEEPFDAAEAAREAGFTEQYTVLSDGHVTAAEYEESIDRVRQCLNEYGIETTEPWINPVDSLMLVWDYPAGPPGYNGDPDCVRRYIGYVQPEYLILGEPRMDEPLLAYARTCLAESGRPLEGDPRNAGDMADELGPDAAQLLAGCLHGGLQELYPEYPVQIVTW